MTASVSSNKTFSSIVQESRCPTRDQAIVVDSVDGFPLKDYALAIAKVVDPLNVIGFSRISQNRVCYYLNNKQLVDDLISKEAKITVGNSVLPVRPLNSRSVRIVISNVQLCIPDILIENELKNLGIITVSKLQHVKSGVNLPGFSHWRSFRRQVFVHPDSVNRVPPSLQITHEGISYHVYLTSANMTCAICSQEGHMAKYCKETGIQDVLPTSIRDNEESHDNSSSNFYEDTSISSTNPTNKIPIKKSDKDSLKKFSTQTENMLAPRSHCANDKNNTNTDPDTFKTNFTTLPARIPKRPLSSVSSEEEKSRPIKRNQMDNDTTMQKKIAPSNDSVSDDTYSQLLPAKELIDGNQEKYCLDFDTLLKLLQDMHGKPYKTSVETAQNFTSQIGALGELFRDVRKTISNTRLKARLYKYIQQFEAVKHKSVVSDASDIDCMSDGGLGSYK